MVLDEEFVLQRNAQLPLRPANIPMFKHIPAAQDLYICFRCQYRLSLRQGPRAGRRRPTDYPQELLQQLRRFTSSPLLRQEQHDAPTDNGNLEGVPIRYYVEGLQPNQNFRHGNEPATKDSLGLNVLGEPAEVLILRDKENKFQLDSNMARVRASGPDKNPAQEPISSSKMLEVMDAERGIVDIGEVCKNIENVRTSWMARTKGSMTGVAYKDLFSRLQDGFTKGQLGAYLDRARKDPATDVLDLNVEFSNSVYARSSWQLVKDTPLQTSSAPVIGLPHTPEEESNKKERSRKEHGQRLRKDALVKRILRQCWNITPRFLESSPGVLDIRLQKLHLTLILNHKRDILKLLSRTYDAKVEAWPQDHIIRITSDYDNCVDIFKLLIHTLDNIQVFTIDLNVDSMSHKGSTPLPRVLNEVMLLQIEKYTNTLVRPRDASLQKLRILYLGPDDADLLETLRLIHQVLRPASAKRPQLAWSKRVTPSEARPAPVVVGNRMSLLNRNQQWSRWSSPRTMNCITRKEEEEGAPPSISWVGLGPATQAIHGKLAFEAVTSFFEAPSNKAYKLCSNDMPYWKPEIEYHDSVNLGQVLFPAKMARSVMVSIDQNRRRIKKKNHIKPVINTREIFIGSSKQPREFLPLVPGFVRSLESLRSLEKSEDFVQIRLSPSSKNLSLPVPVETLPDLEIRISFDNENKTSSIKDVRLVDRKEMDFLQPESVVDLRFVRNKCVYAKNDSIDPRIASFVQNSHFDYWGIGRIKTPPGLSLSVPALAIQPHRNFDPKRYETLPVDYASYGLEHRSSLTMPYQEPDSWPTLTYTNIEAGPLGGRRDEVSMHNLRFASKRISPTDHPDPSAVSNMEDNEPLSNDDHTSMLFHKTDSLIETIELAASDQSVKLMDRGQGLTKGLSMPELQRWRRTKMKTVRRVGTVGNPKQGTIFRPGYVPRVNETVRRVVADHLV